MTAADRRQAGGVDVRARGEVLEDGALVLELQRAAVEDLAPRPHLPSERAAAVVAELDLGAVVDPDGAEPGREQLLDHEVPAADGVPDPGQAATAVAVREDHDGVRTLPGRQAHGDRRIEAVPGRDESQLDLQLGAA
jgi:hypothetical protein